MAEHFTLNSPLAIGDSGQMETNIGFSIDDLDEETFYRNIGFNIEFTTLKSLQINNHKSDISKVNRYTQVRLNQSSRLVNIDLASKNATGKNRTNGHT